MQHLVKHDVAHREFWRVRGSKMELRMMVLCDGS